MIQHQAKAHLFVDAGVEHVRLRALGDGGELCFDRVLPNDGDLRGRLAELAAGGAFGAGADARIYVTGKLAGTVREALGGGRLVLPSAALWLAAKELMRLPENTGVENLAMVDLSASGYLLVGVDRAGGLARDLLVVNPRCGAGSGINLDRVLQKLGKTREDVDALLASYLGPQGGELRSAVATRADRCGVFASSATVSDKNQGIPLDAALATTLKSEVLKACNKLPPGFAKVYLTGRVFRWQFARDCAEDHLRAQGVREIAHDPENTGVLEALRVLVERPGGGAPAQPDPRLRRAAAPRELPPFAELKRRYEEPGLYLRQAAAPVAPLAAVAVEGRPVILALDVGSTMAKVVLADAGDGEILFLTACSNAGDTIETVKHVFRELTAAGVRRLRVRGIGVTGSARYQVQQALARIHPGAADRVAVLVENYAHARGSIAEARRHVRWLRERGIARVDENFCILVDVGGEDTKISTLALARGELFANAMNLKCSAGTGSLMDTLSALFRVGDVAQASAMAYAAPRAFAINATCAVFLMENARRLQAEGMPRDEILASASWAIVENMARTLWQQVELPRHAVVLLHGQTMLSEPLPLAVTHRLQSFLGAPAYALVPAHPGHRACFGLVHTLQQTAPPGEAEIALPDFLGARFEKRIIQCHGAVCGDAAARCNRTALRGCGADGARFSFALGGCTAVNELAARKQSDGAKPARDAYKEIWDFLASRQPHSEDPRRLVIARSFCVSEWAYLLARVFERFGIPVHVDDVREGDLLVAQGLFHIDTCAPQMGAVGQFRRLAGAPHGVILVPQIESLPTGGKSLGLTCTVNQGGVVVASNLAAQAHPAARFHPFSLRLERLEAAAVADQLLGWLGEVFALYGLAPSPVKLCAAVDGAIADHHRLRRAAADLAADLAEEALAEGRQVALVAGREYVLTPGLYDSSVRRLLRDKRMAAIPSYVLDVELDDEFRHLYWRNSHFITTVLKAVAERSLHRRVGHPRLAAVFQRIETGLDAAGAAGSLLPVVQVSTFACGPDSVTAHLVADIMRQRPFLLLQSDAVLKELAHLENRLNTYVKQLELGLHGELRIGGESPVEVRRLDDLTSRQPLDRERDVIYLPTLADNRCVTSVLRGAGFACIDNWDESLDLRDIVRNGRRYTGDSVCAPLAAVYGDLLRAVDDFVRRRERGDPLVAGKRRLLYFDNQGDGPCRQGQYAAVHNFFAARSLAPGSTEAQGAGPAMPHGTLLQLLIGREEDGFAFGIEEWTLYRCYQGLVLQGVLHDLLFAGGTACRDCDEYSRFVAAYGALKEEVYGALAAYGGPGPAARRWLAAGRRGGLAPVVKYFAYRMHGRDLAAPIARFARAWIRGRQLPPGALRIFASGEVYVRVAQAEELFRSLLSILGFQRFSLAVAPLWSNLAYLPEEKVERAREELAVTAAARRHAAGSDREELAVLEQAGREHIRRLQRLGRALRRYVAGPLYRAAGLPLPHAPRKLLDIARELVPTLRPQGELGLYVGEALSELRGGVDLFLSMAPAGCMVASMGEVLTPCIRAAAGPGSGRIQSLFTADGDVDDELLSLALLKVLGPERFCAAREMR